MDGPSSSRERNIQTHHLPFVLIVMSDAQVGVARQSALDDRQPELLGAHPAVIHAHRHKTVLTSQANIQV